MQKQAIFLMGPTAVGKTALAIQLAQYLPIDIISVDSVMVYRGLDIGTGKPTPRELQQTPQQLIDICDPAHAYSAAQFCVDAKLAMQKSWQQQRIPLLVGGTMLYFRSLQFGLAQLPAANAELRAQLSARALAQGWAAMHAELALLDPETARRINVNDPQRIQRALEINLLTGQPLANFFKQQTTEKLAYNLHSFALLPTDRVALHNVIEQRFDQMLEQGLIAEVENLFKRTDLNPQLPALRSVGYRQAWAYLDQHIDFVSMRAQAIAATRQLAKRQLTWLRSWPGIINIENSKGAALDTIVQSVLNSLQLKSEACKKYDGEYQHV